MQSGLIKKNTFFLSISQAGQMVLAFLLTWVAAKKLGVSRFGIYMFASIMSYFLFLLNDLGVVTYVVREVSKARDRAGDYYKNGLILKWILLLILVPLLWLYIKLSGFGPEKMWAVLAFSVFGFFFSMNQLCYAVYRAHERMHYEMLSNLFEKVLITGAGLILLYRGYGVVALCGAFGAASILNFAVNSVLVQRRFLHGSGQTNWPFMMHLLKASFLFGLFWILTNVHERFDVLMLERMTDDTIVGWYTLAYKLILVANIIPIVLTTAALPRISRSVHDDPDETSRIYGLGMKYLFFIALPMIVGTLFLAEDICVFFRKEFSASGNVLRLLIFASGIDFFSIFFSAFLIAWNRQRHLTLLQAGALILNLCMNFVLIPKYQHIGAAAATLGSRGLIFALCTVWVARRFRFPMNALVPGVVSTGIMAIFLWVWKGPLFGAIGLALCIYAGMLLLMGGIRPSEILIKKNGQSES
ncbi:flippase [bacterium]|nr:flippase [bacterium]